MESFPYHIRPIEIEKDAAQVAVLIKSSFRPWLDRENMDYLNSLEKAGREAIKSPFWTNLIGFPFVMTGVVCTDESGAVIGVISTNAFWLRERKCCLISNVCVSPDHRKQGIASRMIKEIIRSQREDGAYGLYLQTRTAEEGLTDFYKTQGFSVTDYRETWILPGNKKPEPVKGISVETVPDTDEGSFRQMAELRYPETVRWNLNYPEDLFSPGKLPDIMNRLFYPGRRFMRAADTNGRTLAWAAFRDQRDNASDAFWFIPDKNIPLTILRDALCSLCAKHKGKKPLKADIPADPSANIFQEAGFFRQQTLAWMWRPL